MKLTKEQEERMDGLIDRMKIFLSSDEEAFEKGYVAAIADMKDPQPLIDALKDCKEKLKLYRENHSGEYIGGREYMGLMKDIEQALADYLGGD